MEVTVFLPHLIIAIKIYSRHTNLNLRMQSDDRRNGKKLHPSKLLFIKPNKILKDYYVPMT
jgi:hypothetical protein